MHDRKLEHNLVRKIVFIAHGSDGEIFLDEVVQPAEIQGPSPVDGEALLNDERGAHLVGISKRSDTH